ncbi:hypothetical protein IQ244_26645 [Nostoc sp. LEGE 06077]|nr:hypothetical protein [Nostoc sp. LEGE 06077]MBE9210008.1 hypothetical protein [Nostoc sp. LEGE 06077]
MTVESLTPPQRDFFSRVSVGFHDGEFDFVDIGQPLTLALERVAEDATH